ncbi:MAG: hypothetical protein Q8M22_17160 [Actinomycetota bacterium]|nr:hypothetical protein [Actinomycetota bacterium]
MKRGRWAVAAVAVVAGVACSDGGGVSAGQFVGQVDEICSTLDGDLDALARPTAPTEVAGFATSASRAYEEAASSLKKLAIPGGVSSAVSDAKVLVGNFDAQVDLLDAIAASAGVDQPTADAKIAEFEALQVSHGTLAASIGADGCALAPLFAYVAPPVTDPVITDPVITDPVVTDPPVTDPVITDPPVTDPPVTDPVVTTGPSADKVVVPFAATLTPNTGFTFVDASTELTDTYSLLLSITPATIAVGGTVSGVEIFDGGTLPVARVFIFFPNQTLPGTAPGEVAETVSGESVLSPLTIASLVGQSYITEENLAFFVAGNDPNNVGYIVWAVSQTTQALDITVQAFIRGLQGG